MSVPDSDATMAVFLDLGKIGRGANDGNFPGFEIRRGLERLLLKGKIAVKKANCDFDRYKTFKGGCTGRGSELIGFPMCTPAPRPATVKAEGPSPDEALDLLTKTLEALRAERGEDYAIRGSLMKQAMKRQNPGFNERAHGFRAFNELLLEAQKRGLVKLEGDKQAGTYIVRAIE